MVNFDVLISVKVVTLNFIGTTKGRTFLFEPRADKHVETNKCLSTVTKGE